MKVLIVLLSLSTIALASLEPTGYRAPGSSRYLPPQHQYQDDQQHHYHQHQPQPSSASLPSPSQYLAPNPDRPISPSISSQYLPPRISPQYNQQLNQPRQQYQPKQEPRIPSNNYLPVVDKQRGPVDKSAPASSDYASPAPIPARQRPLNESTTLLNNYLPPSVSAPLPVPAHEYLPVLTRGQSTVTASLKNNYLPPLARGQLPDPSPNYLPPTISNIVSTTAAPRISPLSYGSAYKLAGSAYSKPQSKFGASGLDASSLSQSNSYPMAGNPVVQIKNLRPSGFDRPADNYLPPISTARDSYDASQMGYRYRGSFASATPRLEQATEEAKYDFEYRVSDEFGNDYAHKESRLGNQIQGVYSVLLPDGRKQIVHYEANEDGFKPRISYEEVASVLGSKTPAVVADPAFTGYTKNGNGLDNQGPY